MPDWVSWAVTAVSLSAAFYAIYQAYKYNRAGSAQVARLEEMISHTQGNVAAAKQNAEQTAQNISSTKQVVGEMKSGLEQLERLAPITEQLVQVIGKMQDHEYARERTAEEERINRKVTDEVAKALRMGQDEVNRTLSGPASDTTKQQQVAAILDSTIRKVQSLPEDVRIRRLEEEIVQLLRIRGRMMLRDLKNQEAIAVLTPEANRLVSAVRSLVARGVVTATGFDPESYVELRRMGEVAVTRQMP